MNTQRIDAGNTTPKSLTVQNDVRALRRKFDKGMRHQFNYDNKICNVSDKQLDVVPVISYDIASSGVSTDEELAMLREATQLFLKQSRFEGTVEQAIDQVLSNAFFSASTPVGGLLFALARYHVCGLGAAPCEHRPGLYGIE